MASYDDNIVKGKALAYAITKIKSWVNTLFEGLATVANTGAYSDLKGTPGNASTSAAGLMSTTDKAKLDGIAANANAYSHPTYTARTGVPTTNQSPNFGESFSITQSISDVTGHITAMNEKTVTLPSETVYTSDAGGYEFTVTSAAPQAAPENLITFVVTS